MDVEYDPEDDNDKKSHTSLRVSAGAARERDAEDRAKSATPRTAKKERIARTEGLRVDRVWCSSLTAINDIYTPKPSEDSSRPTLRLKFAKQSCMAGSVVPIPGRLFRL